MSGATSRREATCSNRADVILLVPAAARSAAAPLAAPIAAIVKVGMTVEDMDRALAFYTGVLDFTVVSDVEVAGPAYGALTGVFSLRARIVGLRLGDEVIELTEYLTPRGRTVPRDSRSNDRWFRHVAIITSDMATAYARLRVHKVRHASTGPQRLPDWNPNAGGIEAFYFHDPDGHVLEILQFPPGKGEPRWQSREPLFLGIDHTAIVVADTAASLGFDRDALGLRVVGASENYGDEQAHLNNVRGAHLRITTLRADAGPGVELLEYLAPRDGRPYPPDARPNDLFHWQTTVLSARPETTLQALRADQQRDGALVALPDAPGAAALVRDPDGHALQVVGP
ncbi:MAG TPA: VOC family protein [Chloroflexota bacterium]|nr:VOC family protein [Chloroflexota bacterium]